MSDQSVDNSNNATKSSQNPNNNNNNNNRNSSEHADNNETSNNDIKLTEALSADDAGVATAGTAGTADTIAAEADASSSQRDSAAGKTQAPPPPPPQRSQTPQPHELTAEWTVRAQLRFARAGERVQQEFGHNDQVHPVHVVYKWTTLEPNDQKAAPEHGSTEADNLGNDDDDDDADDYAGGDGNEDDFGGAADDDDDAANDDDATFCNTLLSNNKKSSSFRHSTTPLKLHRQQCRPPSAALRHESFPSTTSSCTLGDVGGGDSAFSSSNTSNKKSPQAKSTQVRAKKTIKTERVGAGSGAGVTMYGTRCHSTCSIVVSAVADFLPMDAMTTIPTTAAGAAAEGAASGVDNFMTNNTNAAATTATSTADIRAEEEEEEADVEPFVCKTKAAFYTVLPEKSYDDAASIASKNFSTSAGKILALRDAFSQTSDTDLKNRDEKQLSSDNLKDSNTRNCPLNAKRDQLKDTKISLAQQYRPYELSQTTTTAALQKPLGKSVVPFVADGDSLTPSFFSRIPTLAGQQQHHLIPLASTAQKQHSPQQQQQLQQTPLPKQTASSAEAQKKPRTVHIDVYCTGSDDDDDDDDEDEDHADGESSSSPDEPVGGGARHDQDDSNSTPQTVLENEQMLLRHRRIAGPVLPRRIAAQQTKPKQAQAQPTTQRQKTVSNPLSPTDLNLGHAITKSSTAEEVSESKQLLFRKHIGDQRAAKLQNLRQKYMRQPSDDPVLSSNYPNSSRSTVRDATCSSISSAVPSSPADYADSLWKESAAEEVADGGDPSPSLAKSDSFEYENIVDRLRIKEMERFWSTPATWGNSSPEEAWQQHSQSPSRYSVSSSSILQPIAEGNSSWQATTFPDREPQNYSDIKAFYQQTPNMLPPYSQQPLLHLQQTPHFMRNKPGFLQFFGPPTPTPTAAPPATTLPQTKVTDLNEPLSAPVLATATHLLFPEYGQTQRLQRWKSETHDNLSDTPIPSPSGFSSLRSSPQLVGPLSTTPPQRCSSEAPSSSSATALTSVIQQSSLVQPDASSQLGVRRFDLKYQQQRAGDFVSEASGGVFSGYTDEYLEKARKFGRLVSTIRKPAGHHVGPTKNPNCLCDSCQRWLADRNQLRERAFSLGERPTLKKPV